MTIAKKASQSQNPTDHAKRERRKKFSDFKDVTHRNFGKIFSTVGICLRECKNKGKKICDECFKFSKFKEIK